MAVNLLKSRVSDLNQEVLQKLDALSAAPESLDRESRLRDLKKVLLDCDLGHHPAGHIRLLPSLSGRT